jgi:hypothetical protein
MNIKLGKTYKTVNGGSVRIICDDRASMNGKHWVGLYAADKGEWILTIDADGNAYVFDTMKPELNIVPEKRSVWVVSYIRTDGRFEFELWSDTPEHNVEFFEKHYGELGCTDIRTTLVIH